MNTDRLTSFFQKKIIEIDGLEGLGADNIAFQKWCETTSATCKRMGGDYFARFNVIRYKPGVVVAGRDNSEAFSRAYNNGLRNAKALLESFVEDLETWGYDSTLAAETPKSIKSQQSVVNVNVSQHQNQAQSLSNSIQLSMYDQETQDKLRELAQAVRKPNNNSKITPIIRWLADKSVDALIALLPSIINLE